jgi:hypothetical protein
MQQSLPGKLGALRLDLGHRHGVVHHIDHLSNDAYAAGSDHAVVIADPTPR